MFMKKLNISKPYYKRISLFFSKIFDLYYILFFLPYLSYLSGDNKKKRFLLFFNYIIFIIINTFFKNIIRSDRPCIKESNCPQSYDIPSGHSLSGIYYFLLLKDKQFSILIKYPLLLILLGQPIFRYLSNVHSSNAILFGSINGYLAYKLNVFYQT